MDEVFERLLKADSEDWAMSSSAKPSEEMGERPEGICYSHGYSCLSVHKIEHEGNTVRLLRLRNPHGGGEWNGLWSDKSDVWTPELS